MKIDGIRFTGGQGVAPMVTPCRQKSGLRQLYGWRALRRDR
jgi:hypothetical protein